MCNSPPGTGLIHEKTVSSISFVAQFCEGESHAESRAFAGAFALRDDVSAQDFDGGFGDREAEAKAAEFSGDRSVALPKRFENILQPGGIDSHAGI